MHMSSSRLSIEYAKELSEGQKSIELQKDLPGLFTCVSRGSRSSASYWVVPRLQVFENLIRSQKENPQEI
jgi:hypothetical protein